MSVPRRSEHARALGRLSSSRGGLRVLAGVAALLTACGSLFLGAAPASAASTAVSVAVSVDQQRIGVGDAFTATVTIENRGNTPLTAASVSFDADQHRLDDTATVDEWFAGGDPSTPVELATQDDVTVAGGTTEQVTLSVPAGTIDFGNATSVHGLRAIVSAGAEVVGSANTAVAWEGGTNATDRTDVALHLIVPITAPDDADGLIPATALGTLTAAGGDLDALLTLAEDTNATIAIDPRVLVSIRVLGGSAPDSARRWLDRLHSEPNSTFALPYADSDLMTEADAGLTNALQPTSFAFAMDTANFGTGPAGATATTTPAAGTIPSTEQLLDWPYTTTNVAWPRAGTITTAGLRFLKRAGTTSIILDRGDLGDASASADHGRLAETDAVVADSGLSSAFSDALEATSTSTWDTAMSDITARVHAAGVDGTDGKASVTVALDRGDALQAARVEDTVSALSALGWTSYSAEADGVSAGALTLEAAMPDAARVHSLRAVRALDADVRHFSTAAVSPTDVLASQRLGLLAALRSVDDSATDGDSAAPIDAFLGATQDLLTSVTIADPSSIILAATQSSVSAQVKNSSAFPVQVQLDVTPSNSRIRLDDRTIPVTVAADSSSTVHIPVKSKVSNGDVDLDLALETTTGDAIGAHRIMPVTVHADWERYGVGVFGGLLIAFFAFSLGRNIWNRRRARTTADD